MWKFARFCKQQMLTLIASWYVLYKVSLLVVCVFGGFFMRAELFEF